MYNSPSFCSESIKWACMQAHAKIILHNMSKNCNRVGSPYVWQFLWLQVHVCSNPSTYSISRKISLACQSRQYKINLINWSTKMTIIHQSWLCMYKELSPTLNTIKLTLNVLCGHKKHYFFLRGHGNECGDLIGFQLSLDFPTFDHDHSNTNAMCVWKSSAISIYW